MPKSDIDASNLAADLSSGTVDLRGAPAATIRSTALMNGFREVVILHGDERYRLRITANDKLILTK